MHMARTGTPSVVPGISKIKTLGGITEYLLEKNGLRILLAPDASAPIAGCMVTYTVGSRNEATGYTGATHILEHLMFKGSEKFNEAKGNAPDTVMESNGAVMNATTWYDRTNYYQVLPKSVLPLAIEMEADRMRTARIVESDRQSEMPVVRNEFERGENLPQEALDKEMWSAAFIAHPYHHSTIGWRSDIEKVSIQRLQEFYDDFYWPNNATVTIVGDFDEKKTLNDIKKHFGIHPKAPKPFPEMYTEEPAQQGQRRVIVKRAGVDIVGLGYKSPEYSHADMPALYVLSHILSADKTSRLYKALVDTAIATDADAACYFLKDPALFQIFITLAPGHSHESVERAALAVLEEVKASGVTAQEIARAKQSIRLEDASQRDGAYALLSTLNEAIGRGDWTHFITFFEDIKKVTAADVKRVARTYFNEDTSIMGWFINTSR